MTNTESNLRRVYAIDVGSTRSGAFAWARPIDGEPRVVEGGTSIEALLDLLVADLRAGHAVALGLEAPMYIPVPQAAADLSSGRANESGRAWSAPTGLAVTALGLHQLAWIMSTLGGRLDQRPVFTLDWHTWRSAPGPLLYVWEAFVSGSAHARSGGPGDHLRDAATAVVGFREHAWDHEPESALGVGVHGAQDAEVPVLSLPALAALWAGWPVKDAVLRTRTLVVRPESPFAGEIRTMLA